MKRLTVSALFLALGVCLWAQDLDKVVNVTNSFKGTSGEVSKPTPDVTIPDSLRQFDYKFDYSVFDKPYRGAYDFRPYTVEYRPASSQWPSNTFYLKAGAGYTLHPELTMYWNPESSGRHRLRVHQDLTGYYGKYCTLVRNFEKYRSSPENLLLGYSGVRNTGYDFTEKFGLDGVAGFKKILLAWTADYKGVFNQDVFRNASYNELSFSFRMASPQGSTSRFIYDVVLSADLQSDDVKNTGATSFMRASEYVYSLDAALGPVLSQHCALIFNMSVNYADRNNFSYDYGYGNFTPALKLSYDKVKLNLGIRMALAGQTETGWKPEFQIFPDVRADFLLGESTGFYAYATGRSRVSTYKALKDINPWFEPNYTKITTHGWSMNFGAGVKGSIAKTVDYDVNGGWAVEEHVGMFGLGLDDSKLLVPKLVCGARDFGYVNVRLDWRNDWIEVDGAVNFAWMTQKYGFEAIGLPPVSGRVSAKYNWKHRLYAGVSLIGAMDRTCIVDGVQVSLHPYCNLGASLEYCFSRKFSLWIKGDNLLNDNIQLCPVHVESGISGTVGITLSL